MLYRFHWPLTSLARGSVNTVSQPLAQSSCAHTGVPSSLGLWPEWVLSALLTRLCVVGCKELEHMRCLLSEKQLQSTVHAHPLQLNTQCPCSCNLATYTVCGAGLLSKSRQAILPCMLLTVGLSVASSSIEELALWWDKLWHYHNGGTLTLRTGCCVSRIGSSLFTAPDLTSQLLCFNAHHTGIRISTLYFTCKVKGQMKGKIHHETEFTLIIDLGQFIQYLQT